MDIRHGSLWPQYLKSLGWTAEKLSCGYAYSKKIPFLGSILKIHRAKLPLSFEEISALAKKRDSFLIKLEPLSRTEDKNSSRLIEELRANSFFADNWSLNPTKTFQIDLTLSEEELLKKMEKDTRYSVRFAEKNGVVVREVNDLEEFKKIYFDTAKRKKFWVAKKELEALWKTFFEKKAASILIAFYKRQPLAAAFLLYEGKVGQYQHAGSYEKHRNLMAPYLLMWESIKFLKQKGCKIMDLEGIYDPRIPSTRGWKGFTLFKKGFGGREIEYLGSFSRYTKLWSKLLFLPTRFF